MVSYNRYSLGGVWEYEMFTEVLTSSRYPENRKFVMIQSNDHLPMGKVQDYDCQLARLINKAVRNLLQRAGAQGWEPVDEVDADSLWVKGRVRYTDGSGLSDRKGNPGEIEPITVHIFCRRRVQQRSSVAGELSNEPNPALKHLEMC